MTRSLIRAYTVRQPWAECTARGHKLVEGRGQPTHYRGPVLVHAGTEWSLRGGADERVQRVLWGATGLSMASVDLWRSTLHVGRVIAAATLTGCHAAVPQDRLDGSTGSCCEPWGELDYRDPATTPGPGRPTYHWVLDGVTPLDRPVPARGFQGLWPVGAELADQCWQALPAAVRSGPCRWVAA